MFSPQIAAKIKDFSTVTPNGVNSMSNPTDDRFILLPPSNKAVLTVPLPDTAKPGYSPIYRNAFMKDKLLTTYHPDIKTQYDVFAKSVAAYPDQDFLGKRVYNPLSRSWSEEYHFISYGEAKRQAENLVSGIAHIVEQKSGRKTSEKYIVGMYMPNCPQWVITDIACQKQSLPSVCLYDTLGPDVSEYILHFCDCPIVVSSLANVSKLLLLKPKLPKLKAIVCSEDLIHEYDHPENLLDVSLKRWAEEIGIEVYGYSEMQAIGEKHLIPDTPPRPEDIYAINFTSGTTGKPKGAILTHSSIVCAVGGSRSQLPVPDVTGPLTAFSFLPLAHIFERISLCAYISTHEKIAFPHGSVLELLNDIKVAKPHVMNLVPRVLNRIAGALKAATIEAKGVAGALSRRAYASKKAHLEATGSPNHPLWDRVWSNRVKRKIGFDNVMFVFTGSAPLSYEVITFLKLVLGVEILQGYGLTESLSGISINAPNEPDGKSVGGIWPTTEFRIRDTPELNYLSSDKPFPRGELLLRGPQMFKGYYNNPEKTDEALDDEGFFRTGDVVTVDERGRIFIIDRVKNFFKLAQGEYVAAEKIENIYTANCSLLNQIFIHGNSEETYLIGIVALNPDAFAPWVSRILGKRISNTDVDALNEAGRDKKVRKAFLKALNDSVPKNTLQGFEKAQNLIIAVEPLTAENGCLTPTLKIMRPAAVKHFEGIIKSLYAEGPLKGAETTAKL